MTIRGGGNPHSAMAAMPLREWTRRLGALPAEGAVLDRRCARRRWKYAVGTEECSRRGSNKRMECKGRPKWRDAPLTKKAPYKPDAPNAPVRFDEGGVETGTMARLLRHRQTKEAETDRPGLTSTAPHSYSTVKTIACGNAGRFRCTRCYSCAFYQYQVHTRPRVQRAPGIPHALQGRNIWTQLGRIAPRDRERVFGMRRNVHDVRREPNPDRQRFDVHALRREIESARRWRDTIAVLWQRVREHKRRTGGWNALCKVEKVSGDTPRQMRPKRRQIAQVALGAPTGRPFPRSFSVCASAAAPSACPPASPSPESRWSDAGPPAVRRTRWPCRATSVLRATACRTRTAAFRRARGSGTRWLRLSPIPCRAQSRATARAAAPDRAGRVIPNCGCRCWRLCRCA